MAKERKRNRPPRKFRYKPEIQLIRACLKQKRDILAAAVDLLAGIGVQLDEASQAAMWFFNEQPNDNHVTLNIASDAVHTSPEHIRALALRDIGPAVRNFLLRKPPWTCPVCGLTCEKKE